MSSTAGLRTCERLPSCQANIMQPYYEIARQEWTVAGHAGDPFDLGCMCRDPVKPCKYAGKRPGEIRNAVGHNRQSGARETRRIAISVKYEGGALRLETVEHALKDRGTSNPQHNLIAAPHASRQT